MNDKERNELIISWFTLSIAFALVLAPSFGAGGIKGLFPFIPVSFLAVGTAFIFHELAHRQVAKHFGCQAQFRLWSNGLVLAAIMGIFSFFSGFGFLFAAPGAVYVYGSHVTRKQNGLISMAGPFTNIIIGLFFLFASGYSLIFISNTDFAWAFRLVAHINFFLAFFNLLPFWRLDGAKVMNWDVKIWAVLVAAAFFLTFLI